MKTTLFARHPIALLAILVAVLLTVVGCDPPIDPGYHGEVDLTVDVMDNGQQMTVFTAHGAIMDEGLVEGVVPDAANGMWSGYRVLQGGKGEVYLDVDAVANPGNGNLAEGTFTIRSGTGTYEGIEGSGKYTAFKDPNGRLIESFCGCCDRRYQ